MPKLPRSTSSATSSMASGTIPSRPAKPHPDRLKIMHLFPDRPLGEGGDSGVHVEIEPPVGIHMLPDQRCQRVQVSGVQSAGPVRASENPLEHLQRQKLDGVGRRTGHHRSLPVSGTARNNSFLSSPLASRDENPGEGRPPPPPISHCNEQFGREGCSDRLKWRLVIRSPAD